MTGACFLDALKQTADEAERAEAGFRREIADRTRALEQERVFAFRRLNLMHAVYEAIASAENEDVAIAGGLSVVRARLGWSGESDARSEVLSRFADVARAVFASLSSPGAELPTADVLKKLAEFESWYAATHERPFWALFEHYLPETPVVDF
jgi:hypothetical protein